LTNKEIPAKLNKNIQIGNSLMIRRKWTFVSCLLLYSLLFLHPSPASAQSAKIIAVHPGESIQQAIDQARAGSIILVSPGIYYETIQLKKGITLRSETGARATIIDGQNSNQPVVKLADECMLEGFTIIGKGPAEQESDPSHTAASYTVASHTVECINVSPIIKGNIIKNNHGTGIYVEGKKAAPEITGNIIYSNQGAGIGNEHSSRARIVANECYGNTRAGIGIRHQAAPLVENNRSHHNEMAGIGIQGENTSPILKNNHCYFNKLSGVGVENGASPTLEGNNLYSNGRCGVGIQLNSTVVLTGNKINANTLAGIGVMKNCQVTVTNNTLAENVLAGISVTDGSTAEITKNTIRDNGCQGIVCSFSQAEIHHNTIDGNSHHGVAIYRRSKVQLTENSIINNGAHGRRGTGIIVVSSNDVLITRNNFEGNYGPGVYARKSSPRIEFNEFFNDLVFIKYYASPTVAHNTFYSGKKAGGKKYKSGVDIRDNSSPIIINNQFYGKFGIAVRKKSRPLIADNTFSGQHKSSVKSGRSGIKIDKESYPIIKQNIFYNGNKVMTGGKSVNTNITLVRSRAKLRIPKEGRVPERLKNTMILIAGNLFLE
jgi:parallel beta-helix repeat protein